MFSLPDASIETAVPDVVPTLGPVCALTAHSGFTPTVQRCGVAAAGCVQRRLTEKNMWKSLFSAGLIVSRWQTQCENAGKAKLH